MRALIIGAVVLAVVLAQTSLAFADNLISDGDGVAPVADSNLALGNVCAGAITSSKTILVAIKRNGNGTNVFKDGSSVSVSGSPTTSGALSLSSSSGSIVIPSDWSTKAQNTMSSSISMGLTLSAPLTPGAFSQTLDFSATGVNSSDDPLTRPDSMTVTATIVSCDSTAPAVTVTAPAVPSGQGGYFNGSQVPVTIDVSASDTSGVSSISCLDGASVISFSQSGSNPRTGSFQLSADGAHNITCTATDTLSNSGVAAGSSNSATVLIDTVAPAVSCGAADGSWHADNVSISCAASDLAGSGLASSADVSFSLSTAVLAGAETSNASTDSRAVLDVAGNSAAAGPIAGNMIDRKAPALLSCTAPDGLWHATDQSFTCTYTDGGSGAGTLSVTLSTNAASNTETTNASASASGSQAVDAVGNAAASPADITGVKIDKKSPQGTCDAADGIWHPDNIILHCTYTDGGSGISGSDTIDLSTNVAAGDETANAAASAGGVQVCDAIGNCADSPADISGNEIDRRAPQLASCDTADGSWHPDNITLHCTYTDGGSGPATQQVALSTSVAGGSETDNAAASANGAQVSDVVGNPADSPADITGNKIDRKNPAVSCGTADGVWHGTNVDINCTADDFGSGLADVNDKAFTLSTTVGSDTEDSNASTGSHDVSDLVGNTTTAGPVSGNQIDTKAPVVTCDPAPSGWQGSDVTIHCTAVDDGSGLADSGDASFDLVTNVPDGTEDASATTGSRSVCDVVGNCSDAGPFTVQVDRADPAVGCAAADGIWHADNVAIACTASDGSGSGLADAGDASFSLHTLVGAGAEADNASTGSHQVCDAVGNCATGGPVGGNKIDRKAPQLASCDSPDGAWHGTDVTLHCTYTDGGSGAGTLSVALSTTVASGTETANAAASANGAQAVDAVGNAAPSPADIGGNEIDKKAPQETSCDTADGNWHAGNVTLHCTYEDDGSGPASQQVALETGVTAGDETGAAAASANGNQACDTADNCATSPSDIPNNKIDRKAPQLVACDAPDGLWHAADVTLVCSFSDGGSGAGTLSVSLSTNVASGTETSNASASANGAKAADAVGNQAASPADIGGNKVDKKGPTVSFSGSTSFLLNQSGASIGYGCADSGSGVDTCTPGTVDTSSVGTKTFSVSASDKVANAGGGSTSYTVGYASTGLCLGQPGHQVLQPVNNDGSSAFKKGSTVPVKFRVCDANGLSIGAAGTVATFKLVKTVNGQAESVVVEDPISTTPDTAFRWDTTGQQWIFNLNTKNLTGGITYYYRITLNDGSAIDFHFYLKS